jgi:hypothetical protein
LDISDDIRRGKNAFGTRKVLGWISVAHLKVDDGNKSEEMACNSLALPRNCFVFDAMKNTVKGEERLSTHDELERMEKAITASFVALNGDVKQGIRKYALDVVRAETDERLRYRRRSSLPHSAPRFRECLSSYGAAPKRTARMLALLYATPAFGVNRAYVP